MIPAELRAAEGEWTGGSSLWLPDEPTRTSSVAARLAAVAGGKFVQLSYTWDYEGAAQDGLLLLGGEGERASAIFVDSWHMGDKSMALTGTSTAAGAVDVRGTWSVEGGPDWGWRIVVAPVAASLHVMMYVITPEGEEHPGFELALQRT